MSAFLFGLLGAVAPGFTHGLMSQRRAMWTVIAAFAASFVLVTFTVWALALTFAIYVGSMVDAGLRYRRLRGSIRWSVVDPLIACGAPLVMALGLRTFVVEAFRIPSSSQYPFEPVSIAGP